MPFVVALMIVVLALVIVLLATCAHLLARVMRVEGALRAATGPDGVLGSVESIGVPIVRQGAPLPAAIASEVSVDPKAGTIALHVVSAGCASCRPIVDALCRGRGSAATARVVLGHEADRALMPSPCRVPIVVAPALIEAIVMSGWALPVVVRVERGRVVAIESGKDIRV
jgi:hypothetical protein